jgi:hypothetical protein
MMDAKHQTGQRLAARDQYEPPRRVGHIQWLARDPSSFGKQVVPVLEMRNRNRPDMAIQVKFGILSPCEVRVSRNPLQQSWKGLQS